MSTEAQLPHHILVVDDDPRLRGLLKRYLLEQGFEVDAVEDGVELDRRLEINEPDLIVLDLMLPGEDGLSIARRIRLSNDIPIIILSARGEDIDRIVGLEVGADDYLPKPFNPRELLARIRAVLRRRQPELPTESGKEHAAHERHSFGDFELDLTTHQLSNSTGKIPLTNGEYLLLKLFVQNPNRVLSRDQLIDMLKGYDRSPFDRSIDIRVTRLRRKIEADPSNPLFIITIWGEGYLFTPQGSGSPV
jgi:DNA-binding response OmpR family regulator